MIIEIHGAGFINKGAELMLRTTIYELKNRLDNFEPVIDPSSGPYELRCGLGLKSIFPWRGYIYETFFDKRFRKQRLFSKYWRSPLNRYGCVTLNQVQGIIDISGFAYSDQMGTKKTRNFSKLAQYYKSHRKPVILLPQALGPFELEDNRKNFEIIVANSSVIYARDNQSYEYALASSSNSKNIEKAPDITFFYPRYLKHNFNEITKTAYIVPNIKIIDESKNQWAENYERVLIFIINKLVEKNVNVRILVFDINGQDMIIAKNMSKIIGNKALPIIEVKNPSEAKKIIQRSLLLVGSRYHSLVSALSASVPVIGIGWSHKYEELFSEFGLSRFLLGYEIPLENISSLITDLVDLNENIKYRKFISSRLKEIYVQNELMWTTVIETLQTQTKNDSANKSGDANSANTCKFLRKSI